MSLLKAKNVERSKQIVEWLQTHPLLSKNALCSVVGYDAASLDKVMNATGSYVAIPPKHLDDIENILKEYGYVTVDLFDKLN